MPVFKKLKTKKGMKKSIKRIHKQLDEKFEKRKKKLESVKYSLTVTKEQTQVMQTALEFFSRIKAGQLQELWYTCSNGNADREHFEQIMRQMKLCLFPDIPLNASYGVGWSTENSDGSGDIAWDLNQVIRHRLSWDNVGNPSQRDWKTMIGVNFDEPMKFGKEPLAEIERITEDKDHCKNCGRIYYNCVCSHDS